MIMTFPSFPLWGSLLTHNHPEYLLIHLSLQEVLYLYCFTFIFTTVLASYAPFVQMLRECRQLTQGPVVNDASLVLSPDWTYHTYEQRWQAQTHL